MSRLEIVGDLVVVVLVAAGIANRAGFWRWLRTRRQKPDRGEAPARRVLKVGDEEVEVD